MMRKLLLIIFIIFQFLVPVSAKASDDSLALTIIPPLMKMNMAPGETISSAVKIVNNNSTDMEVYTKVLDFKGKEGGGVEFIEDIETYKDTELEKYFLSGWVSIGEGPIKIDAFKSANIPFLIEVPEDASPGGHYAAILVGTKPPEGQEGTVVKISSYVSSLILIKIAGDIEEKGLVREFSTDKKFYKEPKIDFKVVFENLGNVHLQPRGEIRAYNIFGKEKLNIPINDSGNFGNVLPNDTRKWDLSWQTENEVLLVDRFRVELNLSFGAEARQSEYREIYFWVVNVKNLLMIGGIFIFFLLFLIFIIRFYINQSVKNMKRQFGIEDESQTKQVKQTNRAGEQIVKRMKRVDNNDEKVISQPLKSTRSKVVDLRKRNK